LINKSLEELLCTKKKILRDRLLEIRENRIKIFKSLQDDMINYNESHIEGRNFGNSIFRDNSHAYPNNVSMMSSFRGPIVIKSKDGTTGSTGMGEVPERNSSLSKRIPQKLKLIKYSSTLLAYIKTDENVEEAVKFTSRNRQPSRKVTKSLNMITEFYKTTTQKLEKPVENGRQFTPKTKRGQSFFNNYFLKSIASSLENKTKDVTKDQLNHKVNVIDCLAMDNYDRVYHNFYKYSKIVNKHTEKFKSVSVAKLHGSKTSLEDLYSRDLIISNKFLKNESSRVNIKILPPIKKKVESSRPQMHHIFKKIAVNRKTQSLYI
jgi:hypothetical protein